VCAVGLSRPYQQLDFLMGIRKETRKELLAESRKHSASQCLQQIPRLGPIRVALLIALIQVRIVSVRNANFGTTAGWACGRGAAANTGTQGDNCSIRGNHRRGGLKVNHNHDLENLFKSASTQAGTCKDDPLGEFYQNLLARGMEPPDDDHLEKALANRTSINLRTAWTQIGRSLGKWPLPGNEDSIMIFAFTRAQQSFVKGL
jgi:hypothetical protein